MQKAVWQMDFATPAFLGNAEQRAQWRTPPIKALLRQWWRVLEWNSRSHDLDSLRKKEGGLFGVAADDGGESRQSQVRIRLDTPWVDGSAADWPKMAGLHHPEVKVPVQPDLYLGFGPITTKSRRSALAARARADLRLAAPDAFPLDDLTQLVAWFGTLGSRSRNGWGSLRIEGVALPGQDDPLLVRIARPLEDCLKQEWPHALGRDGKRLLVWQTQPRQDWREAMRELAMVKIAFRTQFKFSSGEPHQELHPRHLLAYPVTKHGYANWKNTDRLGNQLRFKVLRESRQFIGLAFHLPCRLPDDLANRLAPADRNRLRQQELEVWRAVHAVLDNKMTRLGGAR